MGVRQVMAQLNLDGQVLPIAGGDVNQNFRINTSESSYFIKLQPNGRPDFFPAEVDGLAALAPFVRVPKVYDWGQADQDSYLLMEWLEPEAGSQADLARALAQVHRQTAETFGWPEDNFMGILPQVNAQTDDWPLFFITCRLDVQVELAKLHNVWHDKREAHYLRLKEFIQKEWAPRTVTPSLLHGDFWSGNVLFSKGEVVFLDPAVSFGDRELDIAMSQLFGGFTEEFLTTYLAEFPLPEGWEDRQPIYQLYYLLVHLNQFGESYGSQVDRILQNF